MVGSAVVVEDDVNTAFALTKAISAIGYSVRVAGTLKEAKDMMQRDPPDVVLLDVTLPDGDGLDLLKDNERYKDSRFVVVTGDSTQEVAVRSLRSRVSDFLIKPVSMAELRNAVRNIPALVAANDDQPSAGPVSEAFEKALKAAARDETCNRSDLLLAGDSRKVQALDQLIQRFAQSKTNVVVKGEAGVDKLAAAFALHRRTQHAAAVYLVQCATGHVVTSANRPVAGFSECLLSAFSDHSQQNRITLVLNDIGALSEARQRELLSYLGNCGVLESHTADQPRIVAVERHSLDAMVGDKKDNSVIDNDACGGECQKLQMLDELRLCLDQCELKIPALRYRRQDIAPIANKILTALNTEHNTRRVIKEEELEVLNSHDWPGNVRELSNVISRAYHASDYMLDISNVLPAEDVSGNEVVESIDGLVGKTFWEVEKSLLKATLSSHDGDKKTTAKTLGISLKTLYNRLNAYSIKY